MTNPRSIVYYTLTYVHLLDGKQEGQDGPGSLTWENMNQMLNVDIYITKNWPSELLFTQKVTQEMILAL